MTIARSGSRIVAAHAVRLPKGSAGEFATSVEHVVELEPGMLFRVRDVSPADEPAIVRLLQRLPPDDIRLRFFCGMKQFGHALVGPLTQLDNVRNIGLVALPEHGASDHVVAHAMLIPEADGLHAEFAAVVDSRHAHHGLGRHLIECLVERGRVRGVRQVYGIVLSDNHNMLQLGAEMGFKRRMGDDPGTTRIELDVEPPRQ